MIKKIIKYFIKKLGYEIVTSKKIFPITEASEFERKLVKEALNFSMTNEIRAWSLIQSIKYVKNNNISGDFVECGVYRGGNLLIYKKLSEKLNIDNSIFGFDTFDGMSEPVELDKRIIDNISNNTRALLLFVVAIEDRFDLVQKVLD